MKYQPGKVHVLSLVALAIVGLLLHALVEASKSPAQQPHIKAKKDAAALAVRAMGAIKEARLASGVPIDNVNDPNETGLIGHGSSLITTDRGSGQQKLRALDPNLAAVMVELLAGAGVGEGDHVAIAATGAFPLLNASAIIAVETLKATPVTITSVGSSSWGANLPSLTWLDMETVLEDKGIIAHRSVAASRGGRDDSGGRLTQVGRDLIDAAIARNGVTPIVEASLDESIAERARIYSEAAGGRKYAAYVNIGSGLASLGSEAAKELVPADLSRRLRTKHLEGRGTLVMMAENGVPIIHVPGPEPFIRKYGLAQQPVPRIFSEDHYHVPLAGILALLYGFLIFAVVRIDLKHYLFKKPREARRVEAR